MHFICGVDDHLIEVSRKLHAYYEQIGLANNYEERPGGHSHAYMDARLSGAFEFVLRECGLAAD